MKQKKSTLILLIILIFLLIIYFTLGQKVFPEKEILDTALPPTQTLQTTQEPQETPPEEIQPQALPSNFNLPVPFTTQAPTANWDELHNEACEEASVLMANAFFQGDKRNMLPPSEVEKGIEKLTKWQQNTLGYHLSIDSQETVRMITSVYGLRAEVVNSFTEDTLKRALTQNKLVLVPANGRLLGNPYFQTPGPIYHMFVIKGYDEKSFITNDPGTKRGQDYRYTFKTIKNAVGDYNHDTKETDPRKPALIIVSQ